MKRKWSLWGDALCWGALAAYVVNRWVICSMVDSPFLRNHFNDLLLMPAALPIVLEIQGRLGWRPAGQPPQAAESIFHLAVWSVVCEGFGPRWFGRGTPDAWDVVSYAAGAMVAQWWWRRWEGTRQPEFPEAQHA